MKISIECSDATIRREDGRTVVEVENPKFNLFELAGFVNPSALERAIRTRLETVRQAGY